MHDINELVLNLLALLSPSFGLILLILYTSALKIKPTNLTTYWSATALPQPAPS